MRWLTRVTVALLQYSAGLLPADRRVWARALVAEADELPAGWRRLAWLAGGVRLTVREAMPRRRLGYPLAFAAAAVGTAWSAWSGPPGDAAIVINRVDVIAIVGILAALPWIIARARGPIAAGRRARLVRTGGYAAVLALAAPSLPGVHARGLDPSGASGNGTSPDETPGDCELAQALPM